MAGTRPKDSKKLKQSLKVITAYKKTFSGPDGEAVLEDLMKSCGMFGTTFVPGDPCATAYSEGARTVVLRILDTINMDTEKMLKIFENQEPGVFGNEDDL